MAVDVVIRVSLQSNVLATQAVHKALTGQQFGHGKGPFHKTGTATFVARNQGPTIFQTINDFTAALDTHSASVDFMTITIYQS